MSDADLPGAGPSAPGPAASPAPGPVRTSGVLGGHPAVLAALGLGATLAVFAAYSILTAVVTILLPAAPRLGLAVAQVLGLGLPALLARHALDRVRGMPLDTVRLGGARNLLGTVGAGLTGAVAAALLGVPWVTALTATGWSWLRWLAEEMAQMMAALATATSVPDTVATLLTLAVVPAVCEELIFRGGLQRWLSAFLPAPIAIGLTAVTFSVLHLDPFGLPSRVVLGISLGLVYHRSRSLVATGLVHALNNCLALAVGLSIGTGFDPWVSMSSTTAVQAALAGVIGAFALLPWAGSVILLKSALPVPVQPDLRGDGPQAALPPFGP